MAAGTQVEAKQSDDASSGAHLILTELIFSGGERVPVDRNAVVVIVGPNNSGKTRALSGIHDSVTEPLHTRMVCKGTFRRTGTKEQLLERVSSFKMPQDDVSYVGHNFNFQRNQIEGWENKDRPALHGVSQFFCILLDTGSRLQGCGPGISHQVGTERPQNAFQLLYEDKELEAKVSKMFRELFRTDLVVNTRAGSRIPLHVADRPKLEEGEDLHSTSYIQKVGRLPMLNDQGDGMKSFGAVLLNVKVMPRDIVLIDEPEAFLHPPQERRMGRLLAEEQPKAGQIVVATHSESIIQGMLSGKADRVSIIRLTRDGNKNHAKPLSNAEVAELWKSPILRYSNVLSGLFHEAVVIIEADADCRFYDAVVNALPVAADGQRPPDIFYTHSGGKDRMPTLIAALKRLDVPVRAVADVDVLREEPLLRKFVEALGGDWAVVEGDWKAVKTAVEARKTWFRAGDLRERVDEILSKLDKEAVVPKQTVKELEKLAKQTSPWDEIKRNGLPGPLTGEPAKRATALLKVLSGIGLFVPPVGEIECFAKTVGGHGPAWVETVLAKDVATDPELQAARHFVGTILASLRA